MTHPNDNQLPFSKRHGYTTGPVEITIWEDAPEAFRYEVLSSANSTCNLKPSYMRAIICHVLRTRPDPNNWSEYPNIWSEVESLVDTCAWYKIYDIVEEIAKSLQSPHDQMAFETEINDCLRELGIGWQLQNGIVQSRGGDTHEKLLEQTKDKLKTAGMTTAQSELAEAVEDLSRRPNPDLSGAVQHAMAALECVARKLTGESKATLGKIMGGLKSPLPKPLNEVVEKTWGYASENARHGREDRTISRAEAQLIVGLSSSLALYLIDKQIVGD